MGAKKRTLRDPESTLGHLNTPLLLGHRIEGESGILPGKSGREAVPRECAKILSRAGPETKAGEKWASLSRP